MRDACLRQRRVRTGLGVIDLPRPHRSGIPSDYVFRTGGDTSIRGYAFESLGVQENGAVVGGRYLTVASAETIACTPESGSAFPVGTHPGLGAPARRRTSDP